MTNTLRQTAYTRFRESLFKQTLKPGQFISQGELSKVLDVPLGAIREALKRLEADGLINLIAQRGVQIADINVRFINEAFEFRIIIECEAARRMARNPDTDALNSLRTRTQAIIDKSVSKSSNKVFQDGLDVDLELHNLLIGVYSNGIIRESYRLLEDKIRLVRLNGSYTSKRLQEAMKEHLMIIDALLAGEEVVAEETLRKHLKTSWRRSLGQHEELL